MPYNLINLGVDDLDTPVYRVFNFQRLLELFAAEKNVLVKPSKWDDPFENYILKTATEAFLQKKDIDLSVKDKFYGQCWTITNESDAMWRIYSPEKNGVTVKLTVRKLIDQLHESSSLLGNAYIGKVNYLPQDDLLEKIKDRFFLKSEIIHESGQAASLLFKRTAFAHENEVRLIFRHNDPSYTSDLFSYTFRPYELDEIRFDPRISLDMFKVFEHYLKVQLDYKGTVSRSELYELPNLDRVL